MSAIFKMPYILFNRGIKIRLVWVKNEMEGNVLKCMKMYNMV